MAAMALVSAQAQAEIAHDALHDQCRAIDIAATQLERNGAYLLAVKGQAYDHAKVAREVANDFVGDQYLKKFADKVSETAEDEAEQHSKVASDDYAVAERLRAVFKTGCR